MTRCEASDPMGATHMNLQVSPSLIKRLTTAYEATYGEKPKEDDLIQFALGHVLESLDKLTDEQIKLFDPQRPELEAKHAELHVYGGTVTIYTADWGVHHHIEFDSKGRPRFKHDGDEACQR